jgi:UDPglucose 6-dehydrogenase
MKVCAVGLGRLGLAWALLAEAAGHQVVGVDIDQRVVEAVNRRQSDIAEPGVAEMLARTHCSLRATTSIADGLAGADVSVLMVPTPGESDGSFGLRRLLEVVDAIGRHIELAAVPHVVVVVSTVSPGAVAGPIRSTLERAANRQLDVRLGLAFCPEFHAIGSVVRGICQPDLLIVGADEAWSGDVAARLWGSLVVAPVRIRRMSSTAAELAKLALNCYVTTKISFANFIAELSEAYGADGREVCDALGDDPRVGASYLRPGAPFGGPCFPYDNPALSAAARNVGVEPHLPDAVAAVNERRFQQLQYAVQRAAGQGTVGVVGLEFKAGTGVLDGSPAVELARRWVALGLKVLLYEPALRSDPPGLAGAAVASSVEEVVASSDVVVLASGDPVLAAMVADAIRAATRSPVVIDTWVPGEPRPS